MEEKRQEDQTKQIIPNSICTIVTRNCVQVVFDFIAQLAEYLVDKFIREDKGSSPFKITTLKQK